MFSPALGRAVRSASCIAAPPVGSFGRPAVIGAAAQQPFQRPSHHRRLSSSKASAPPAGSKDKKSEEISPQQATATANKASTATANKAPAAAASSASTGKAVGRPRKRSSATPAFNVPHVPPTDYLQQSELQYFAFFSLHRPISLTTPIPAPSTSSSFDSIFKVRASNSRKTMLETMNTLSGGIESLDAAVRVHDEKAPFMSQYNSIHFQPPPAPLPAGQVADSDVAAELAADKSLSAAPAKQRAWSTEVVVTESTDATGKRSYSATTAPMVEISIPAAENSNEVGHYETKQPFLQRMKQRQITNAQRRVKLGRSDMLAISVKRQRKLKMKKHKYKKLMKRTRLERRKLDRT